MPPIKVLQLDNKRVKKALRVAEASVHLREREPGEFVSPDKSQIDEATVLNAPAGVKSSRVSINVTALTVYGGTAEDATIRVARRIKIMDMAGMLRGTAAELRYVFVHCRFAYRYFIDCN